MVTQITCRHPVSKHMPIIRVWSGVLRYRQIVPDQVIGLGFVTDQC
jgi:hypothetical protein